MVKVEDVGKVAGTESEPKVADIPITDEPRGSGEGENQPIDPVAPNVESEETAAGRKPYTCSICGEYFESKAKKLPRHTCKEPYDGRTGQGMPAEGHPEFTPKEEPTPGDVSIDFGEDEEDKILTGIPFSEEPKKKTKPKKTIKRTAKADKERVGTMVNAVGALLSGVELSPEEEATILIELVSDSISLNVDAAEVHIGGYTWIGLCAALAAGFFLKRKYWNPPKPKHTEILKKDGPVGEEDRW